jgi:hypothetical protein
LWFRNLSGTIRKARRLVVADSEVQPSRICSQVSGDVEVSGDKTGASITKLRGDTVATADRVGSIHRCRKTGGGSTILTIKNDPKDLNVMEYCATCICTRRYRAER